MKNFVPVGVQALAACCLILLCCLVGCDTIGQPRCPTCPGGQCPCQVDKCPACLACHKPGAQPTVRPLRNPYFPFLIRPNGSLESPEESAEEVMEKTSDGVKANSAALEETKSGNFKCVRCQQSIVGEAWHTVWCEDGTSSFFLCKSCWNASTPQQRLGFFNAFVAPKVASNVSQKMLDSVRQKIMSGK